MQDLLRNLTEANDSVDYYAGELETTEEELRAVKAELKDMKDELEKSRKALEETEITLKEGEEKCAQLSDKLRKSKETAGAELKAHEETISVIEAVHDKALADLRAEHQAAIIVACQEKHISDDKKSTIVELQLQLDNLAKENGEKNDVVSDLTKQRDAARGELALAAATSSSLEKGRKNNDKAMSKLTAKHEAALRELSASRDLLRTETAAKEQAQGAAQEFQGQLASIEVMIDTAINLIGCADTFVYQSKLDYITASAEEVLNLQAEKRKIHLELMQERKAKQESGGTAPDVQPSADPVVGMSDELEAELRAQIQQKSSEVEAQAARIERQKMDMKSQGMEVVNLTVELEIRAERIRALEMQLAREQTRATELQEVEAQNALLSRKLDLATPKIAELEKKIGRRETTLARECGDKMRAEKLLAETEKKLEEAKEQSMFRRIANKLYILRIDKDTELIASHAAKMQKLKNENRQNATRYKHLLAMPKPIMDGRATLKQLASLRGEIRWAMEQTMKDEMRPRIRMELENAFSADKREKLKAELAREFIDIKGDGQRKPGRDISPIHVSFSDVGVQTLTTTATPSAAEMRIITTIALAHIVVLSAALALFLSLGI